MATHVLITLAVAVALLAAVIDARSGRIPNWLTFPIAGLAPVLHFAVGGLAGALGSLAGLFVCAAVPGVLYVGTRGRAIGGGDVKLFAALGACLGMTAGLEAQLLSYVVVSVFALARLAWHGRLLACLANTARLFANAVLPKRFRRDVEPELLTLLRMGPAICVATLVVAATRMPWFAWI